jgi:8-oxo-dGTP diphosphatase
LTARRRRRVAKTLAFIGKYHSEMTVPALHTMAHSSHLSIALPSTRFISLSLRIPRNAPDRYPQTHAIDSPLVSARSSSLGKEPAPMDLPHIVAAGGIVVRHDPEPLIGIVQLRRNKAWVLPKGKLNGTESALAAAKREVLEETGHDVSVHEFVGALSYESRGLPKVVQFWRMQVLPDRPQRKLNRDVRAVEWLPLPDAIERLSRAHERVFLEHIGPVVLRASAEKKRARTVVRRKPVRTRTPTPRKRPARVPAVLEPVLQAAASDQAAHELPALEQARAAGTMPALHDMPVDMPMPAMTDENTDDARMARSRPWLRRHVIDPLLGRLSSRTM